MADSTVPSKQKKFPLFIHKGTVRWCKTVRYRHVYFGLVADDPEGKAALELCHKQKDDLLAGRTARGGTETVYRLKHLANAWLTHKLEMVAAGELAQRSFDDYKVTADLLIETIGAERTADDIGPHDFAKMRKALAKRYNPQSMSNGSSTFAVCSCTRTKASSSPTPFDTAIRSVAVRRLTLL